ncbi:hypothetical protein BgAZ_100930 [Babesia gibsoni]|uniref:Uncharacterized protein n=1 Tax=Babesia gibsoni TaxID=33632 RepID=A0AAD8PF48_BABGI|nr:hypothetical protein BgAZ_100930 [Babesia gibsoni]
MHLAVPCAIRYRVANINVAHFSLCRDVNVCDVPERLLSLLPKGGTKGDLDRAKYEEARHLVQCVNSALSNFDLNTHVLREHSTWIAAAQRAQRYSLDLSEPLRVLATAISEGKWKLKGIASREFGTLANVCSKAGCPEARSILRKMCSNDLIGAVLPDMRHSDFALFLTSLAKSRMIHRLHGDMLEDQFSARIPTMDTFDIAVTCDATSGLCFRKQTTEAALERFSECLTRQSKSSGRRALRKIKQMNLVQMRECKGYSTLDGILRRKKHTIATWNEIALLLRAVVRQDGINSKSISYVASILSHLNVESLKDGDALHQGDSITIPRCTTLLMSLCCILSQIEKDCIYFRSMEETMIKILKYVQYKTRGITLSYKERTKLCLAINTYWHLVSKDDHHFLLLDAYKRLVGVEDALFLGDLEGKRNRELRDESHRRFIGEVHECLTSLYKYDQKERSFKETVVPPYCVTVRS